jgi:hypothetical protein
VEAKGNRATFTEDLHRKRKAEQATRAETGFASTAAADKIVFSPHCVPKISGLRQKTRALENAGAKQVNENRASLDLIASRWHETFVIFGSPG